MKGGEDVDHGVRDCPEIENEGFWKGWMRYVRVFTREIFEARRLERFSGCQFCGIPQQFCDHWQVVEGDEGSFRRDTRHGCQYEKLMVEFFASACVLAPNRVEEFTERLRDKELWKWMGQRVVMWNGIQTNRMCGVFFRICSVVGEVGFFKDIECK